MVLLSDLLTSARVKVPLEATTKEGLLHELVAVLAADRCVSNPEQALRVVLEREAVLSTGIGDGVAIPHGKTEACRALAVAAGVTARPIDFDALDGEPVRVVFMLVGPETAAGEHIKALSRIARLVRQPELRLRLAESRDAQEFLDRLREAEAA